MKKMRSTSQKKVLTFIFDCKLVKQKKKEIVEDPILAGKKKKEVEDLWKELNSEPDQKKKKVEEHEDKPKLETKEDKKVEDEKAKQAQLAKEALEALKAMKSILPCFTQMQRLKSQLCRRNSVLRAKFSRMRRRLLKKTQRNKKYSTYQIKNQQRETKMQLKGKQAGLDSLLSKIQGAKGMNTIDKSKKDWEKYVENNRLEKELSQNRKDGYMAKQKFLADAEKAEKEKAKGPSRPFPKKQLIHYYDYNY
eukprot:TRINITY_DN73044_c1_g1_i1.p3 TRINITY_DN73044_c1_g1~~TRINITY_DN73044_c1_g1_i1.p3  ORF type:complete len:250 (+),score=53.12 TRINITY_DN73044_c1_g1_i1:117-866(+)